MIAIPEGVTSSTVLVQLIPLDMIRESPSNPRKAFGDLDELAEDIRAHGVLQPVLCRPLQQLNVLTGPPPDLYELVFGARRFRAAQLAGLDAIPSTVRELDDREVLEIQVSENLKRADLHPLEEADGYRRLHEDHGLSVEEMADRVGKSRAYVYARLKLCALCEGPRAAFLEEKIDASTALLIARIPVPELQAQALEAIVEGSYGGEEPMSVRAASDLIRRRFMLRLADAPFSTTDPTLDQVAGTCAACPKRTGAQAELFADVQNPDVCTDPSCFERKRDAEWSKRVEDAERTGGAVLTEVEAKKVFPYGGQVNARSAYISLDGDSWIDGKATTWKKVLGRAGRSLPVTLARDTQGGIHELVRKDDAAAALRKAGKDVPYVLETEKPAKPEEEKKAKKVERAGKALDAMVAEVEERSREEALVAVVAAAEKRTPDRPLWKWIAQAFLAFTCPTEKQLERRACKDVLALEHKLDKMDEATLRGLACELAIGEGPTETGSDLEGACKLFGVDLYAIEKRVREEVSQRTTAEALQTAGAKKKEKGGNANFGAAKS